MAVSLGILLFLSVLGAIVGSFINALSFRFNTGKSMWGRSRCMHCGHTLSALDLVPVLSFLFLGGECRYCHAKISLQYLLVELSAAVLLVLVYLNHQTPFFFVFWSLVWFTLLFAVVYDLRHTIVPWSVTIILLTLAGVHLFTTPLAPYDLLAGVILSLPLFFLVLVSLGKWMGLADPMLELVLGSLLGLSQGIVALVFAFWSGALLGIALTLLKKRYTIKSEIPFVPFLVFGAAVAHFLHVDFFSIFGANIW